MPTIEELQNTNIQLTADLEVERAEKARLMSEAETLAQRNKDLISHNAKLFARVSHKTEPEQQTKETSVIDLDTLTDRIAKGGN